MLGGSEAKMALEDLERRVFVDTMRTLPGARCGV